MILYSLPSLRMSCQFPEVVHIAEVCCISVLPSKDWSLRPPWLDFDWGVAVKCCLLEFCQWVIFDT